MTEEDEGRKKALQLYKILAFLLGLLGTGLLICGLLAVMDKSSNDGGMPYFLGGFIVGILTLTSAAVCACIFLKAPSAHSGVKKKELVCTIEGLSMLSMFTFVGCFLGCFSAGLGGWSSSDLDDENEEDDGPKKTLSIIIIIGCISAIFLTIFSIYIYCTYGSYFGVKMHGGRRGRIIFTQTDEVTTNSTVFQANTFQIGMQTNHLQMSQLETQNRLLQQQLDLQRQMFEQQQQRQQQQQQQQQRTQYSRGVFPPPTPTYGFNNTGHMTPPPSYEDVI